MEFDNSFEVPLPPAQAWAVLTDIRRIAPCMPGAELTDVVDERTYRGRIAVRLVTIHDGLMEVVAEFQPSEAAAEATFVNKDASATLKLGQARGVALLVPARAGLPVAEYAQNLIKKTIVGTGHGDKAQIRMMIGILLPRAAPTTYDAADALAIAVTHAHHRQSAI